GWFNCWMKTPPPWSPPPPATLSMKFECPGDQQPPRSERPSSGIGPHRPLSRAERQYHRRALGGHDAKTRSGARLRSAFSPDSRSRNVVSPPGKGGRRLYRGTALLLPASFAAADRRQSRHPRRREGKPDFAGGILRPTLHSEPAAPQIPVHPGLHVAKSRRLRPRDTRARTAHVPIPRRGLVFLVLAAAQTRPAICQFETFVSQTFSAPGDTVTLPGVK